MTNPAHHLGDIEEETRRYIWWPVLHGYRRDSDFQFVQHEFGTLPVAIDIRYITESERFDVTRITPERIEDLRTYWHALGEALAAWDRLQGAVPKTAPDGQED